MSFFSNDSGVKLGAMELLSTNVMVADVNYNIIYMNETMIAMMQNAESDIRKDLPNFNASKLIGQNIDVFHKNPAHQRGMLDKLQGEYKAKINVGGRAFEFVAHPVFDKGGKRTGTVVEWLDATEINKQKYANMELSSMADAVSKVQAVIQFNLDGTIITANDNFLNALGYTLPEIQGKHHSLFVEPAYKASHEYVEFWSKLNRGEFVAQEFKRIGKGGKVVWINASYNPLFDDKGKVYKVVKYATDITKQVDRNVLVQKIVNEGMAQVGDAIANASSQSMNASSAAAQTSANVQTVAAASEELNASVKEISQSMVKSKEAVNDVVEQTNAADAATQRLVTAAQSMGNIVELIQSIAGQINLLALNATIESARAGEAGKGFAVVASEVKNLAGQTTKATEQIAQEISSMQSVSGDVVKALGTIKSAIDSVNQYVTGVAGAIEEQSAVTREISSNMQTAAAGVQSISNNIGAISSATKQADEEANKVKEAAKVLSE